MMNDSSNPNHIADDSVQRTSLGRRLQHALTGSPNRRFPGLHSPPGGAASTSLLANRRLAFPILALLALLTASLLFLLPGGPLHAQEAAISYPENGTGAVATLTAVDPEGESISWDLSGTDAADFDIENGVLRFKSSPDFEIPADANTDNTYEVTVEASDGGADTTAMEEVTIEVTNVEEPGTVMLTTLQPQVGVTIMATLTDPDNIGADNLSSIDWQWYRGNTAIAGATNGTGAITSTYTPAAGDIGSVLSAKAMYDDDEGDDKTAEQESAHAAREAPTSNVPPSFPTPVGQENTDQEREIPENTPAGTNIGAPVTASDTDVLTYSLETPNAEDAANFDVNRATGQLITKAALDHEGDDEYDVVVHATDPFGADVMAAVTIMVTDVNEAPSVTGASSIDHAENGIVLDVSADGSEQAAEYTVTDADAVAVDDISDDADIKWLLSGADSSKFDITTTGATRTLSFKAMPDFESPGDSDGNNVYEVTVMVTDTDSNTDEQAVMVKVTNVEETGMIDFSTLQPRVGFPVTATLTDPDNVNVDSLEWQWYRGANFTDSNIPTDECDSATADDCLIKDATSASYRPAEGDDGKRLTAVATYTDGHANEGDAKDIVLARGDNDVLTSTVNQAPEFPDQDDETEGRQTAQERSIAENSPATDNNDQPTPIGNPVIAMDEDSVLTYALGGPDAGSFAIHRATGQLQVKAALDKEMKDTYTVTVTATDSLGLSSTITVTIKVTDVDEMPDLEGEAPEEYAENGTAAVATFRATDPEGKSITWTLDGTNVAAFSIDNGVLRFESSPDYEDTDNASHMYTVTIQASDGGADTTATKAVTIEITNVEETGTVTLDTLQPQVGVDVMATLSDPDIITDADLSTVTWQWYRGSSPITNATDGANALISMYTPDAGDVGSTLRAQAMYDDGEGDDKTTRVDSYRNVRSAPADNSPPAFPDQNPGTTAIDTEQDREVAENTPAGRNIGASVAANDPGDVLTYSLSGAGAASFDIVRSSGQLQTKAGLDSEGTSEYIVTVTATDPFESRATSEVTITVTDVNEAPMLTGGATSIDRAENGTDLDDDTTSNVMEDEFTVADEDIVDVAANLKWSLSGADADKFDISTTGSATRTLSLKANPDYESPGDSGRDNVYEVTVKVTDTKGNSDEQDVTVKVTNVEETGTVTLSTLQPRVDFPVTATLADVDNITAGSVSWQWYKGTVTQDGLGTLDAKECVAADPNECFIKGATSATYTPVANDVRGTLVAVALYTDGKSNEPADAKDFAMMVTANTVLADTRNKAPFFPDQDAEMEGDQTNQERSVLENVPAIGSAAATLLVRTIGSPVVAMDSITANDGTETSEPLTYSLGGPDAASFSIDRTDGQLSTKVELDKETKDTYTVTVTATDPSGETATVTVTITVTNVDEAPMIMVGGLAISGLARVEYAEDRRDAVDTYTASGPESTNARWSLGGDDAADFRISAGGELTFVSARDYENPADADMDNVYMVTIMADDGTYMNTRDVTVRVTDVDDMITGDDLVDAYDANSDGEIDRAEVGQAVRDFIGRQIEHDDVVQIIAQYFRDLRSGS